MLITLVPGIDTALVTRNVVARGRRAGLVTALGTSSGLFVHAAAVALGVSAILVRSATAFTALKLCGAVYLTILGVLALRASWRQGTPPTQAQPETGPLQTAPRRPRRRCLRLSNPYMQGLLTNVTNPKAAVFFLTFLPQFLTAGHAVILHALALAVIPVTLSLAWLGAYTLLIGRFTAFLRRPTVRRYQERLLGIVFIGFGIRLAAERL